MKLERLTRIVINKNDYGLVEYIPEIPCIRVVRIGFHLSEEIKENCTAILSFLQKRESGGKISLLYDLQEAEPMLQEDLKWIAEVWKPKIVALGLTHVAIVPPDNIIGQVNINIIQDAMKNSQASTIDRSFSDNDSALKWLKEVLNH